MTEVVKIDSMPSVANPVEGVDYNVVQGTPQNGDPVRVTSSAGVQFHSSYTEPATPTPSPSTLSATAFNKHCWAALGGSTTGMARFQSIIDAAAASTGAIKAVHTQYQKSQTFDKAEVQGMLVVIASVLNAGEADAILNTWPEA